MREKYPIDHYAPPALIRYCDFINVTGRTKELCDFIGVKRTSSLSNIISMRQPLPLEMAIKIVAFSNYELYLGDLCTYLKPYLPKLARQQLKREGVKWQEP